MNWTEGLNPEIGMVLGCAVNMLIGGLMAIYIRELYKRYGSSLSDRESFPGRLLGEATSTWGRA